MPAWCLAKRMGRSSHPGSRGRDEIRQLDAKNLDAAVSALNAMPSMIEKLTALSVVSSVELVTIDKTLRLETALKSAISASLANVAALQDAVAGVPLGH